MRINRCRAKPPGAPASFLHFSWRMARSSFLADGPGFERNLTVPAPMRSSRLLAGQADSCEIVLRTWN